MNHHNWTQTFENVTLSSSSPPADTTNEINGSDQMPFNKTIAITYPIVFIVGFLGNTFAIYVVARYSKLSSVTNIYIINLAIADELYILGIPFVLTNNFFSHWLFGDFFCKMFMTTDAMCQFASTFCLTLMSIDRFLAVVFPIRSAKWRTPPKAKIFSGIVWLLSFVTVLPVTIYSRGDTDTCNLNWPEPTETWSMVFILYTSTLGFFCPLIVICFCYLLIVIKMKSASARAGLTKRRRSERKVTRMVVIIVSVFVLCWLPFFTANIVNLFYSIPMNEPTTSIYFSLVILTYVNSCANPFLYSFLSENFKKNMKEALKCGKRNDARSPKGGRQNAIEQSVCLQPDGQPITSKPAMNGQ